MGADMRAAVIDNGTVINIILVDDLTFNPGEGLSLVASDIANIGDTYADGVFTLAPAVVEVPQEVTMRQARLALLGAGVLSAVNAALNALPSPMKEAAQIDWEYAATVRRDSTLVSQLGPSLGLSDAQIDALFIGAAAL